MSLKIEFIERATMPGANLAALCREFDISRPTAYKWLERFKQSGYDGLEERSRRPLSAPYSTAEDVVVAIIEARAKHQRWGARKLSIVLRRTLGDLTPSEATIDRVLKRLGKLRQRRAKRKLSIVEKAPQVLATKPNDVWTIDFKGWWRSQDLRRCEPLTIRDAASRFVLCVKLLTECTAEEVRRELMALFRRYGVPKAIQCDNGKPFISVTSMGGLSSLSAWWVALGIQIVRSRPGCPQDNGGHERMHADLAADVEATPAATFEAQQKACDRWRQEFNHVRPHQALAGKTPAEVFVASGRRPQVRPAIYPPPFLVRKVTPNGQVKIDGQTYFVSSSLRGHKVGLQPLEGLRHRVWFYELALGDIEVADVQWRHLDAA